MEMYRETFIFYPKTKTFGKQNKISIGQALSQLHSLHPEQTDHSPDGENAENLSPYKLRKGRLFCLVPYFVDSDTTL